MPDARGSGVGVVAIGRNEGERLRRCLASALAEGSTVVYVDSGSADDSVSAARSAGAEVVALDRALPFTAARARNEGFRRLREIAPQIGYVQFVDGDCELVAGWLARAVGAIAAPRVAVVVGRRRERYPERSVYNRLCDMEWASPVGEATACGGDALVAVAPFEEVGGYETSLIAGEEPDLCVRLRGRGWKILRIDAEMTLHDAAMERFWQWWRRNERAGHAFAEVSRRHRAGPEAYWLRETRSNWLWGLALPIAAAGVAPLSIAASLGLLCAYPAQVLRVLLRDRRLEFGLRHRAVYALASVLGKFPQALGQTRYLASRLRRRPVSLIEYKGTAS